MKYETKLKLEAITFFGTIIASLIAVITLMVYGNEFARNIVKHILGY